MKDIAIKSHWETIKLSHARIEEQNIIIEYLENKNELLRERIGRLEELEELLL